MQPAYLLRAARSGLRAASVRPAVAAPLTMTRAAVMPFSTTLARRSGDHAEETFEEFTAR